MLRSDNGEIEVAWVPRAQIPAALDLFGPFILRGIDAAHGTITMQSYIKFLIDGAQLGIVYDLKNRIPLGAFLVELTDEAAWIYALSGEKVCRWANLMERLIVPWIKANGVNYIRAIGRPGWLYYFPGIHVKEKLAGREVLLEKNYGEYA